MDFPQTRRALLCPTDTTGLVDFARGLKAQGWMLIVTDLVLAHLRAADEKEFKSTPLITAFVKGRVVEGISDVPPFVELVCAHFENGTADRFDRSLPEILGGSSYEIAHILDRAVHNFPRVLTVTDPSHYPGVLQHLDGAQDTANAQAFCFTLMRCAAGELSRHFRVLREDLGGFRVDYDGAITRFAGV